MNAGELERDKLVKLFSDSLIYVDDGKRKNALVEFARRCPLNVLETITRGGDLWEFIGAEPGTLGEYVDTFNLEAATHKAMHLIYLNPALERSEPEVAFGVVAHEIAHVWLKHGQGTDSRDNNREADRLAVAWGFAKEIEIRNRSGNQLIIDFLRWITKAPEEA